MHRRTSSIKINLTNEQRDFNTRKLAQTTKYSFCLAKRAHAVLLLAEEQSFSETSA